MKTQDVRLVDVFILGPFMIYAGTQLENEWLKTGMIVAGAMTIAYNWQNWRHYERGPYIPHVHTAECPSGYVTGIECNE